MARVELPLTGRCQCGALTYEVGEPPSCCVVCHCTNCQRISGSAFACNLMVAASSFHVTAGETTRIQWLADSGNSRWGDFCATCGSRIVHGSTPSNGMLSLRSGTLDDRSWLTPIAHIWTRSAQPWVTFGREDLTFETSPPSWSELIARFQALGLFAS